MASPDWFCGIFPPSTMKWYQQPQFGLTAALAHTSVLPDITCCRVFSLLVAEVFLLSLLLKILPMSNNRCCSFPASLKKHCSTHCNLTHPLLSDHFSLPMFYHFIFFLPLLPGRPRRRLDTVLYLLPLIPKQSCSRPVRWAIFSCPVSTNKVFAAMSGSPMEWKTAFKTQWQQRESKILKILSNEMEMSQYTILLVSLYTQTIIKKNTLKKLKSISGLQMVFKVLEWIS